MIASEHVTQLTVEQVVDPEEDLHRGLVDVGLGQSRVQLGPPPGDLLIDDGGACFGVDVDEILAHALNVVAQVGNATSSGIEVDRRHHLPKGLEGGLVVSVEQNVERQPHHE